MEHRDATTPLTNTVLGAGADTGVVAKNGLTALGYAKENAQLETAELLRKASPR